MAGYREEADVAPDSMTETYVAAKLYVDNWRWADTPFYIRTGKRLPRRETTIAIQFKRAPHPPFELDSDDALRPNVLLIHIQPDEGVSLAVGAKESATIPTGSFVSISHVDVIPPKKDDGVAALKALADPTRKDKGNLRYDVYQQKARPNHFTVVEVWTNLKAADEHEIAAHTKQFRRTLGAATGALYDHFVKFERSRVFFLGDDGEVDRVRIERRKHSLGRWLRETAQVALTQEFSYYVLTVALAHGHRERPPGMIPQHLVVGAMSLTQSALAATFQAELAADEAAAASVAWSAG